MIAHAPLKILFISNRSLLPIVDGHTRRSFNVLKGLSEKNQVYFLSLVETPMEMENNNVNELKKLCQTVEFYPSPSKKISTSMIIRLLGSFFSTQPYTIWRHYSKQFLSRVEELIQKESFDIIHCDILPMAYTISKATSVFRSLTNHDVSYLKCLRMARDTSNSLLKMFCYFEAYKLKKFESIIFDKVDLGIVVSEVDKLELQKICPDGKFEVIENGVDADKFNSDHKNIEPNTLLWLGGFAHYSNKQGVYWFLEKIYPIIKEEKKEIKFQLVGGRVTDKLRHYASVDPSIELLGYVDDPLPYLQKATVFIAPILSGSGTKLKLLEAMAAGKAIVTTSVGCEGIEGIDKEHFLIADSPKKFAHKVVDVINDEKLRHQIGCTARELILQKYGWGEIINKINSVYANCNLQ